MKPPQNEDGGSANGESAAHSSNGNGSGQQRPEHEMGAHLPPASAAAVKGTKTASDAGNGHEGQRPPFASVVTNGNGNEDTADKTEENGDGTAAAEEALIPQVAALKHIASTPSSASGSRPHSRFSHVHDSPAPPPGQAWRAAPFHSNQGKTADWFSVPDLMPPVDTTRSHIVIRSPVPGLEPLYYQWPPITSHTGFCPLTEALDTMQTVLGDAAYAEAVDTAAFDDAVAEINSPDFASIAAAVEEYNKCITAIHHHFQDNVPRTQANTSSMHHIMNMVYNRSVTDPSRLNRYKGWTEEVYGEFSFNMISEIVAKVPIKNAHRFVDLGSGVGQVVLQVAGEALCAEAIGVEKQDIPAEYAKLMEHHYLHLMAWFGKRHGAFTLTQNDFLDPELRETIKSADVIFVNNFAFGTRLNQALKEIFSDCKEGCRIVSSLNFSPLDFSITHRTLSDLGSILKVEKITCRGEGVSWTSGPFDYYIQTVDRSKLEVFFSTANRLKPVLISSQRSKGADKHTDDDASGEDEDGDGAEDEEDDTEASDASPPRRRGRGRPPKSTKKQKKVQRSLPRKEQFDGVVSLLTDVVDSHLPQLAALCKQLAPLDEGVRRSRRQQSKQLADTRAQIKAAIEEALTDRIREHQARLLDDVVGGEDCIGLAVSAAVDNEKWLRARERMQAQTTVLRRKFQHLSRLRSQMMEATRIAASLERILDAVQAPDTTAVRKALQDHDVAAVHRFLRALQGMDASAVQQQQQQPPQHQEDKHQKQHQQQQQRIHKRKQDQKQQQEEGQGAAAASPASPSLSSSSPSPSSSSHKRRSAHAQHRSKRTALQSSSVNGGHATTTNSSRSLTDKGGGGGGSNGKAVTVEYSGNETRTTAVAPRLSTRELEAMWANKLSALPSPPRVSEREHVTSWNMWKLKVQKSRRRAANPAAGTSTSTTSSITPTPTRVGGGVDNSHANGTCAGTGAFVSIHSSAPMPSSSGRAPLS